MNIFLLDDNKILCARYHNNKHVVKMVTETAEILSTALHRISATIPSPVKRLSHVNHPCVIWAARTLQNFLFLCELGLCISDEYTFRFGKTHGSAKYIYRCHGLIKLCIPRYEKNKEQKITHFPLMIPEECICESDSDMFVNTVNSYREYYKRHKRHIAKWTKREVPYWFK